MSSFRNAVFLALVAVHYGRREGTQDLRHEGQHTKAACLQRKTGSLPHLVLMPQDTQGLSPGAMKRSWEGLYTQDLCLRS